MITVKTYQAHELRLPCPVTEWQNLSNRTYIKRMTHFIHKFGTLQPKTQSIQHPRYKVSWYHRIKTSHWSAKAAKVVTLKGQDFRCFHSHLDNLRKYPNNKSMGNESLTWKRCSSHLLPGIYQLPQVEDLVAAMKLLEPRIRSVWRRE